MGLAGRSGAELEEMGARGSAFGGPGRVWRRGQFIGSGVIEAGCKTVIGSRWKQPGMFWGEPGIENVPALRCIQSSRRLGEFWRERLNTHAARNDSLALAA